VDSQIDDVTTRRRAGEELERRVAQQAGVAALGLQALEGQDLRSLMDDAARIVASALDVELVKVGELLPGASELLIRAGAGWRAGVVGSDTEPAGSDSAAGYSLRSDDAVVSDDLAEEHRFDVPGLVHEHGARSAAAVVIGDRRAPFGVLSTLSQSPRRFSDDDVNFLHAVAHVLATTVERSRTELRLRDALEAERRRIARDLHDEALRDLSLALTDAQRAQPEGQLVAALKRVGHRLRSAIYDLRLAAEQQRPLRELLEELAQVHRAIADGVVRVQLDVHDGAPRGSFGHRGTELLRIVGEALTNALRHSGARSIRISAWACDRTLWVEVADDGRGFDPDSAATAAWTGLRGMRERVAGLGSELTVRSETGQGTSVRVGMPLVAEQALRAEPVRVLLVDDHAAVREAIALAFGQEPDFEVTGQAASLAEARQMLQDVDVAVIDLGLPDGYGGDLVRDLRELNPEAQAIVLSASIDRSEIARAVDRGAAGVLEKTNGLDEVVQAVRRLHAGETLLPLAEVVELLREAARDREREHEDRRAIGRLTPREREVLQLLAEGLDSKGIADRLHITVRTERNHVANILAKLGVHSQLQALVFALRCELIEIR
jgi:DNA-binding NarL/FixJ family response regulator/signal transduction histidine kinase